ncbi:7854_t:CDS:2 [Funneliformis mosseae]|uniref:7854_t:CDS:1 n=1 Tax=Funneliformis mosseae TaxID=27381 RepID=A0A9N9BQQ4_FUNMO|nr:7854_t:CDS:2 [Funneliformis mosseae]
MKISLSLIFTLCLIFTVAFAAPIASKNDSFELHGGGGNDLDCHTPEGQNKFRCR